MNFGLLVLIAVALGGLWVVGLVSFAILFLLLVLRVAAWVVLVLCSVFVLNVTYDSLLRAWAWVKTKVKAL